MAQGYLKFHREWLDNPIITRDSDYLAVWVYLLSNASHTEREAVFNGEKIKVSKGQLITSCKEIYERLKIERNKLNRILKRFKNEQLIEQQTNNHKSLITLARWDFYQGFNEQPSEQQMSNQRATEQETENEKEKSSKREKDKEKEKSNNGINGIISLYVPQTSNDVHGTEGDSPPKRDKPPKFERNGDEDERMFNEFWKAYPKKVGKGYARSCFKKIRVSYKLLDTMLEAIKKQKKSDMWTRDKCQYIPNPSTWLNQQRWEDDLSIDTENTSDSDLRIGDFGITL